MDITLLGNEGFRIDAGGRVIYIDAFYSAMPGVAGSAVVGPAEVDHADLILVTHAHWDHFSARKVLEVARRTGAVVVGPAAVTGELADGLPAPKLVTLEPPLAPLPQAAQSAKAELPGVAVTAMRTFHGEGHNSYLVETPAGRLFHDGDNGDTRRIDAGPLGRLDALLIGPWQGSGWVEFIERLSPRRYFLMHLTDSELDEHEAGRFLPEICDRVPEGLVVLRPGERFVLD